MDADDNPYIIDFSIAVEEGTKQTVNGDILFIGYELLNNMLSIQHEYTKAIDIYPAGVVLYYMSTRDCPITA